MPNPLSRKLLSVATLPPSDIELLDMIFDQRFEAPAHTNLINEGDAPACIHLITDGFACRSKGLSSGRRQIVSYLVPGDLCDAHVRILGRMDHTISTLTDCTLVRISQTHMDQIMERPSLARAMWWSTLVEESVLREWLVNVGSRPAKQRLAHLFCELYVRLRAVGLAQDHSYSLPLTQHELGETVGLTSVHVNRALQAMRAEGLIVLHQKELEILDPARLVEVAGFHIAYLHFGTRHGPDSSVGTELDAGPEPRRKKVP
ncbi:MAG: Crp/Fnr family transcriptional regulator [Rhizobiaceae bacterium]|nr:Crp/Fnr family transcriptional regulator [Rhizobiaceae bacterium]